MLPSRRDVLRLAGLATVARLGAGCGDNLHPDVPGPDDGVAIFEPTTTALLVAVWSTTAASARVTVALAAEPDAALREVAVELAADSGQGVVDLDGLTADTAYAITVTTDRGIVLGPHLARTAPPDDATRAVRIAVSADLDPAETQFATDLLDRLVAEGPELYVSIGDFPYTDDGPVAQTVPEYRARYAALRTAGDVRRLHEAVAMRCIYDDHEFRNNWDAMFVAAEPARYAAAMQVWDEFFPLRGAPSEIKYRSWRWGAHVECFLLDCRRFRSADAAPDDAQKTMLGATQLQWLLAGLAASPATFKLIFTSIPLDYGTGNDDWTSFATERQAMFDGIVAAKVSGVLFISGDQHWFASQQHAYGIREFQIGPIQRGLGTPPPAVPNVRFRAVRPNVGLIDVTADALTFTGLGAGGDHFYSETLTVQELTPA